VTVSVNMDDESELMPCHVVLLVCGCKWWCEFLIRRGEMSDPGNEEENATYVEYINEMWEIEGIS
jgi:hypothetical protein